MAMQSRRSRIRHDERQKKDADGSCHPRLFLSFVVACGYLMVNTPFMMACMPGLVVMYA